MWLSRAVRFVLRDQCGDGRRPWICIHRADMRSEPLPMPTDPATVPMFCPACHGAVTLQFTGWWLEENLSQTWACPYCGETNEDGFPYRLAWVTKGHESAPKV